MKILGSSFELALLSALAVTGCGGGPADGDRAVLPADYKEKEAKYAEGFRAMMKAQSRRPRAGKKAEVPPFANSSPKPADQPKTP